MSAKLLTLVFCRRNGGSANDRPQILLGMKKAGFGAGRWNGFGGKVEPDESVLQAAERELTEECHLTAKSIQHIGTLHFSFVRVDYKGKPAPPMEVHVFETYDFVGHEGESDEMIPKWFDEADIPFSEMWPDDKYWFPWMLSNRKFDGYFAFDDESTILEHSIKPLVTTL
eukprot:c11478_g1_i1.p1 GENE.c11478_g1_i1~~c11478_g1_i1.p1  ORF type:complete len:170 (-),score=40.96 c11478_g1_i1:134-643(-)